MQPGYVSHRAKAEDFVEVDEEEARTSLGYSADEGWPALKKREGRRPADQERLLTGSRQMDDRAAAYLSSPPHRGGGGRDPAASPGHGYSMVGTGRESARRSPFLLAAELQLDQGSTPGEIQIPGQLSSPKKRGGMWDFGNDKGLEEEAEALIKPKFGAYIPMEVFEEDDEMKHEASRPISYCFTEDYVADEKRKIAERTNKSSAGRSGKAWVTAAGDTQVDTGASFGTEQESQRLLDQKHLKEIEVLLEQAVGKADAMYIELSQEEKRSEVLTRVVVKLKSSKLELDDRMEEYTREMENIGSVKGKNAEEEKKFRELELKIKREEAKRKAEELGFEHEEDERGVLDKFDRLGILPLLRKLSKKTRVLFRRSDTTFVDCRMADSRFGSGIALYFWFYRWVLQVTLALWVVQTTLFIPHIIGFAGRQGAVKIIDNISPTFMLYSSIDRSMAVFYAGCSLACCALLILQVGAHLAKEYMEKDRAAVRSLGQATVERTLALTHILSYGQLDQQYAKLAFTVDQRYAKLAFTAWDWSTTSLAAADDLQVSVASNFKVLEFEDKIDEIVRARSQKEWNRLRIKRTIGLSLNAILLAAGSGTIIYATFALAGTASDTEVGILERIKGLLPTLLPTIINALLPMITDFCVQLEAWDQPTTVLKMRVGRLYCGKMLNALIQLLIVLILLRGPSAFGISQRILKRNCLFLTCEDQIGVYFFTLFVTDVVVGSATKLLVGSGTYYVFTKLDKPTMAKAEFQPPPEIIKILYQQVFLWLMLPYFPFGVIFALLLWFCQFKVDVFDLRNFKAKPARPFDAKDSGVYFAWYSVYLLYQYKKVQILTPEELRARLYFVTLSIFLGWSFFIFFLQVPSEMDVACCDFPKLIEMGNTTSRECLAVATRAVKTENEVYNIDNSPQQCILQGLSSNGLTDLPNAIYGTIYGNAAPIAQELVKDVSFVGSVMIQMLNTPLLGWFCASIVLLALLVERMRVSILDQYLDEKYTELDHQRASKERQIAVRERRIQMNLQAVA